MLERLVIVAAIVATLGVISLLVRRSAARGTREVRGRAIPAALGARLTPGASGVLFFHGPHCASCAQQSQVLDRIEQEMRCAVVHLDAIQESEVSRALNVRTVPTTVVVAPDRTVRSVNLGFRGEAVLRSQLEGLH